ncbi:hypothetical protein [Symbiopectobacterium sp. RP]|uniref:hypothetical protein n=1 Tax=Symbiopectobacterium sp. RP TaxID=3248553 RepID=UPI003D26F836
MNHWNGGKVLSNEELQREIKKLKKLVFLMYSKLPQSERQAVFDELNRTGDRDDLDTSSNINKYRI